MFKDAENASSKQGFRQSYGMSNRPLGFGTIASFKNGVAEINTYELNAYNPDDTLSDKRTFHGDLIT